MQNKGPVFSSAGYVIFIDRHQPAWQRMPGLVRHAFTHFPLELVVYAAEVAAGTPAPAGMRFVDLAQLDGEALPKVMRKVVALAMKQSRAITGERR